MKGNKRKILYRECYYDATLHSNLVFMCLSPQGAGTPGAKGSVAFLSSEFVVKPRVGVVFIIVLSVEQANVPTQLEW